MKISVFSAKWWAGKTPIATNLALEHGLAIGTNETYHVFDGFIPSNQLIALDMTQPFPTFWDEVDIVFDLAWSISETALSITSAIEQSDVVIIPIYNEVKSLAAWLNTISEVSRFNSNIIVVATKLKKKGKNGWKDSADFLNIQQAVHQQASIDIPVVPLKFSAVFDNIFEKELSIKELMKRSPLAKYQYREVSNQFDALYSLIQDYAN